MNDDPEQLDRHVEDLLQDQRPERTPLPDEAALRARQTAAMLRAAKPGAGLPSKDFLERMQGSIHEWVGERSAQPQPPARPSRRSLLLTGAAGIAAGVAAAVGIDRLSKSPGTSPALTSSQQLVENGSWKAVKAAADLPEGTPVAFRAGAIEGFLIRHGQEVKGLSAVCTHMGCILNYSKFRDQFECPCHGATFKTNGQPTDKYDTPLPRLPTLQVRIQRGQVEVYTV
ncbi:MAG: Rieske (2Fe-2S) protein [Candidatus Dormibacteraeota bacterium]|nr:Rieske (2Fe-2S) protein [Candidatus Dormibacteraeota bacterium]